MFRYQNKYIKKYNTIQDRIKEFKVTLCGKLKEEILYKSKYKKER